MKKYVEICVMLFKNTNQTPPRNQMVNQKRFECELQPRPRVEVANNQKKKKGLTMLIVEALKAMNAPIWNRRAE